jgi:hypothetical protein
MKVSENRLDNHVKARLRLWAVKIGNCNGFKQDKRAKEEKQASKHEKEKVFINSWNS